MNTNDQSEILNEMIVELLDNIIIECIPPKKYSHEWNVTLLKDKFNEIFGFNLPIKAWVDEEGVDEEEIKKRIVDKINKKYTR